MSAPKKHVMWVWRDAEGSVRFVGHGKLDRKNKHPASILWSEREKHNSPLHEWLATLPQEPDRMEISSAVPMSYDEIMAAVMALRVKYASTLLSSRPRSTYKGGYPNRPVYGPNGGVYMSVREAAQAIGKNPATVTRWCKSDKHPEWGYVL